MVSRSSSDDEELPPGWREHVKVTNSRKIKFYTHSKSGLRLYSKKRVLSLDQMALEETLHPSSEQNQKSITTRSQEKMQALQGTLQSSSEQQQMPKSEVDLSGVDTHASLDWLPYGWIVESKVRKTGTSAGTPYKIYVDPSTGCKFNSKPKVMKYLKNVYGESMSEKQEVSDDIYYKQKGPQIIPIEEKTDTCVMHDIHAAKVSLEVSVDKSYKQDTPQIIPIEKNTTTCVKDDSQTGKSPVVSGSTRLEELPLGWVKELRCRKGDPNKKDPYYIDLDSGYEFRSKKDALRYLETGDMSRCAMKPRPRKHVEKSEHFIPEVSDDIYYKQKGPQIIPIEEKTDTCVMHDIHAAKVSLEVSVDKSYKQDTPQIIPIEKNTTTCVKDDSQTGKSPVVSGSTRLEELPLGWVKELRCRKGDPNKKDPYYIDLDSGYEFRSKKDALRYLETGDMSRCAMKPRPRKHVEKSEHFIPTPTRTACKWLDRNAINHQGVVSSSQSATVLDWKQLEVEKSKETKTGYIFAEPKLDFGYIDGKKLHSEDTSRTRTRTRSQLLHEQKHQEDVLEAKKQIEQKKSMKRKSLSMPARSSKRLLGVELDLLPVSSERAIRAAVKKAIQGQIWVSSTMENGFPRQSGIPTKLSCEVASPSKEDEVQKRPEQEAIRVDEELEIPKQADRKLEEEQEAEEVHNVQDGREVENSWYPFSDSLADPCYEFAFKTLTGEIAFENKLSFPSLFVHHDVASSTQSVVSMGLPTIGTPALFRNDIPFQLDSVHDKALTDQLPKTSTLPPANTDQASFAGYNRQQPSL